jgi:hypothetical protein
MSLMAIHLGFRVYRIFEHMLSHMKPPMDTTKSPNMPLSGDVDVACE